jgi:CRP/FNR family transcriptional regulator
MSFSSIINHEKSKIFAITDQVATILLVPSDKVNYFLKKYPSFNTLFYHQYNLRYTEMIATINHLLFEKMDIRLMDYLKEKLEVIHQNPIKISHREIANDLGTAREVITRVIKKLESENKVKQSNNSIKIL